MYTKWEYAMSHTLDIWVNTNTTMRGVGCIINDYLDRDIDIKVNRTSHRPLAQEKITIKEALIIMIILLTTEIQINVFVISIYMLFLIF